METIDINLPVCNEGKVLAPFHEALSTVLSNPSHRLMTGPSSR
jgi:hypothetical protein